MFFDLFSSIFKIDMYIELKNYFILGKGTGLRNWQNIQNLFMVFQMKQRLHWNHVPYHHWTYQLNPLIHQVLFPNQENQLSKQLKKNWISNTSNTQCLLQILWRVCKTSFQFEIVFWIEHSAKKYYCIVYDTKLDVQHVVPLYEIFIGQRRVLAWVLPDDHAIYGQYNSSCENVFLSNLDYSLNPYNVCQG